MDNLSVIISVYVFFMLLAITPFRINGLSEEEKEISRHVVAKFHFYTSIYMALLSIPCAFLVMLVFGYNGSPFNFDIYYLESFFRFLYIWPFKIVDYFVESSWNIFLALALLFVPHLWVQHFHWKITDGSENEFFPQNFPTFVVYLILFLVCLIILSIDFFIYINSKGG